MNLIYRFLSPNLQQQKSFSIFLIMVLGFFVYDIGSDISEYEFWGWHFVLELTTFILAAYLLFTSIVEQRKLSRKVREKENQIHRLGGELAFYIDAQFEDWELTTTEKEVGWLLLKGFSFVDIADLRGAKEKTMRQQAANLYAKTQLKGRNELTAFFIEDLLSRKM